MALSTLGGLAASGMANLQRSSEGIVQPLDAIEARRAARAKEQMQQQEANAATMKAQAAQRAAAEAEAAGQAKRAAEQATREIMANMPEIDVESMSDPDFTQGLRGQILHLRNSGDPAAIAASEDLMDKLKSFSETGQIDPNTAQGSMRKADVEAQQSQTELNRSMTRMNTTDATKQDVEWATAFIHQNDPGRQGMFNFKRNYTPEQRVIKANELASILDQVKREYAANNGGAQMPLGQAQNKALAEFARLEQSRNPSAAQPEQQPMEAPAQQPMQQPVQQQPPPVTQGGKIDFDWSDGT